MAKNLGLLTLAVFVGLLCGELAVRAAIVAFHRTPIVVSERHTGWAGRPDLHDVPVTIAGGQFRVSTDQSGRRLTYSLERAVTSSKPDVLLVGDSFVFGLSVDDTATFGWQLARAVPDRRIVNLGVPGWGTDQELLNLEDYFASGSMGAKPTVSDIEVVVFENDFLDVQRAFDRYLGRGKAVFHVSGAGLKRGSFHLSLLDRLMDHSRLVWLVRSKVANIPAPVRIEADSGVKVVLACLSAIRGLGEANGARVHIFAHRRANQPSSLTDSVWGDFVARAGAMDITHLFLKAPNVGGMSPIGFDGVHWSAEGHRRLAMLIQKTALPLP